MGLINNRGCIVTTDWTEEKHDASTREGRKVEQPSHASRESLVPVLKAQHAEPADEFLLGLNNRERQELLQLLEEFLTGNAGRRSVSVGSVAVCQHLHDKLRVFGA